MISSSLATMLFTVLVFFWFLAFAYSFSALSKKGEDLHTYREALYLREKNIQQNLNKAARPFIERIELERTEKEALSFYYERQDKPFLFWFKTVPLVFLAAPLLTLTLIKKPKETSK